MKPSDAIRKEKVAFLGTYKVRCKQEVRQVKHFQGM